MFPKAWPRGTVCSRMNGQGVDDRVYNSSSTGPATKGKNPVLRDLAAVQLQLEGAKPMRFRVADWKDVPIEGARMAFQSVHRIDREEEPLEINGQIPLEVDRLPMDAIGMATIDWFPVWLKRPVGFVGVKLNGEFVPVSVSDLPAEPDRTC